MWVVGRTLGGRPARWADIDIDIDISFGAAGTSRFAGGSSGEGGHDAASSAWIKKRFACPGMAHGTKPKAAVSDAAPTVSMSLFVSPCLAPSNLCGEPF